MHIKLWLPPYATFRIWTFCHYNTVIFPLSTGSPEQYSIQADSYASLLAAVSRVLCVCQGGQIVGAREEDLWYA